MYGHKCFAERAKVKKGCNPIPYGIGFLFLSQILRLHKIVPARLWRARKIWDYLAKPIKSSSDFIEQPLRDKFYYRKIWVYRNKSMGRFIFILGGVRSGKSRYALELAKRLSKKVLYIATCTGASLDSEMNKRIALHKKTRPKYWRTIEAGSNINSLLMKFNDRYNVIIIDCMGLLVSNLLEQGLTDKKIYDTFKDMPKVISRSKCATIVVSNEAGGGIVPDNYLARRFRDLLGLVNQIMAGCADKVIFMQSGIPITIKGDL